MRWLGVFPAVVWAAASLTAVVDELRHTFGLRDMLGSGEYFDIMDGFDFEKDAGIQQDDKDAPIAIYKTHMVNKGW